MKKVKKRGFISQHVRFIERFFFDILIDLFEYVILPYMNMFLCLVYREYESHKNPKTI